MVRIISDTLSSIPVEEARKIKLPLLPQIVIFGEESFRDDTEIDSATFIERLKKSNVLPKTTAPYPHLYQPILEDLSKSGDEILIICPTSKMSGTFSRAMVAAQEFPDGKSQYSIHRCSAPGWGRLLLRASMGGKRVKRRTFPKYELAGHRTYFWWTRWSIFKGGRIGAAKALVGSVLQVKPILGIENGE